MRERIVPNLFAWPSSLADVSPKVAAVVERAVVHSFVTRPLPIRGITTNECRRRVKICEGIWTVLRIDHKWSVPRVCDHLYGFLLAELDGISWEPDKRSLWVPASAEPKH